AFSGFSPARNFQGDNRIPKSRPSFRRRKARFVQMRTRLLTAAIAIPILVASIILPWYFPETVWIFVAVCVFSLAAGLFEFFSLTKKLELKGDAAMAYLGSAALTVAFIFDAPAKAPDILLLTVSGFVAALLITQTFRFQKDFSKMLAGAGV